MEDKYLQALKQCKLSAKSEYAFANRSFEKTKRNIATLSQDITDLVSLNLGLFGEDDPSNQKILEIASSIDNQLKIKLNAHQSALQNKAKNLEKFTVMLFGRTMAGKSTVREAITGGNGDSIGQGAQRTTRDVKEYEWNNLRIIDTPGFGAWKGEEDTQLAHSIVDESDLILFLLTDDSIQESTFEEMKLLTEQNKPIIFIFNVKRDLTKKINRKRFLKDPDAYFSGEQFDGHIQRLNHLAQSRLNLPPNKIKILALHAQAAFLAGQSNDVEEKAQLLSASKLPSLFDILREEIIQNGVVRRIQTLVDGTNRQVNLLGKDLSHNLIQLERYRATICEK